MKTLNIIQKISKLGKILSRIVFVFSLVGVIGSAVGLICLAAIPEGSITIGDLTIHGLIESEAKVSIGTIYTVLAMAIVMSAGEAFLSHKAARYFENELKAGTPFTFEGADEMKRLGIYTIVVPIITAIVAAIVYGIMSVALGVDKNVEFKDSISISLGVMFIVTSLICRYGAELTQGKSHEPNER